MRALESLDLDVVECVSPETAAAASASGAASESSSAAAAAAAADDAEGSIESVGSGIGAENGGSIGSGGTVGSAGSHNSAEDRGSVQDESEEEKPTYDFERLILLFELFYEQDPTTMKLLLGLR